MQQSRLTFENGHLRIQNPCQHQQDVATCRQWTESNIDDICLDLLESSLETVPISATGEQRRGQFSRKYKIQSRLGSRNGKVVVRGPLAHITGSSSEVNTKINDPRHSLLTLPAEIRLSIYRHLLVSTHLPVLCPIPDGFRIVNEEPFHPESGLFPQILQTCKMINNEATSMLYSENLFRRNFYWPSTWSRRERRIHWPLAESSPINKNNLETISRIRIFKDCDKWLRNGRLRVLDDFPGLRELQVHVDMRDISYLSMCKDALRSIDHHRPDLPCLKFKIRQPFDQAYKDWCNECEGKSMSFSLHVKRKNELEEWMTREGLFVGNRMSWSFLTELSDFCGPSCIIGFAVDQSRLKVDRIECCVDYEGEPTFTWLPVDETVSPL
ncbi:hypothetical protein ACHAPU_003180 [Fusarium lateritium]